MSSKDAIDAWPEIESIIAPPPKPSKKVPIDINKFKRELEAVPTL